MSSAWSMQPLLASVLLLAAAVTAAPDIVQMLAGARQDDDGGLIGRPDGHELPTEHWQLQLHKSWWQFKQSYGRAYADQKEESERMSIFIDNMEYIRQHNELADRGLKSYRLGITPLTDMTHGEFLAKMTGLRREASQIGLGGIAYISPATEQTLPSTVDWRTKGAVTPVKDQGQCGSCWSFSSTGALEGQHFRKAGKLLSLSEQQLVDCSGSYGNMGCNGGFMDSAFKYVRDYGIELESTYPYKARGGSCRYARSKVVANCTGFVDIPRGMESKLQEAVANVGPVAVAIDASQRSFQHYSSGVYDEPSCSSSNLDHGVLAVGYGSLAGKDYWLVKNSWSEKWGDSGYIRMSRNKGNQCGIATSASYPTV